MKCELTAVLFNKVSPHSLVVLTSWLVLTPFLCLFNMSYNLLCSISELCSGLRKTNRPKSIPIQVKIWTRTRCSGLKKTQYVSSTRDASSNAYKIWGCTCGGVYVPCFYSHARWEYTVGDSGLCCYVFQGLNIVCWSNQVKCHNSVVFDIGQGFQDLGLKYRAEWHGFGCVTWADLSFGSEMLFTFHLSKQNIFCIL